MKCLQWLQGKKQYVAILLIAALSMSAGALHANIGLLTGSSGNLEITSDGEISDVAGSATATVIAPDMQVCDERTAMVARFNADGELQVCRETGDVDAEGDPIWDWTEHQVANLNLGDNAVEERNIGQDQVQSRQIQSNSVTESEVADNTLRGSHLVMDAISQREMADNAVGREQIRSNAVSGDELANNAVGSPHIRENAVTGSELASNAVDSIHIRSNAVGSSELASGAVANTHIQTNTISRDRLGFEVTMSNSEFMSRYSEAKANCTTTGQWRIPNYVANAINRPTGLTYNVGTHYSWSRTAGSTFNYSRGGWQFRSIAEPTRSISGFHLVIDSDGSGSFLPGSLEVGMQRQSCLEDSSRSGSRYSGIWCRSSSIFKNSTRTTHSQLINSTSYTNVAWARCRREINLSGCDTRHSFQLQSSPTYQTCTGYDPQTKQCNSTDTRYGSLSGAGLGVRSRPIVKSEVQGFAAIPVYECN